MKTTIDLADKYGATKLTDRIGRQMADWGASR